MLWDLLSGFVLFLLRLLVSLSGPRTGCAAFASVFPLLPQRNLPPVATHRIGVHRHHLEKAFAPFLFLTSTDCGYGYIINYN